MRKYIIPATECSLLAMASVLCASPAGGSDPFSPLPEYGDPGTQF